MRSQLILNRKLGLAMAAWALGMACSPGLSLAIPSDSVAPAMSQTDRQAQMDRVMQAFSKPQAQIQLRALGYRPDEMRERLVKLDDAQLSAVARRADAVAPAGHAALGIGIGLVVLLILIILLVNLLDDDDIEIDAD